MLTLLTVLAVIPVAVAQPTLTTFTPEAVGRFLKENPEVKTVESFLESLPRELKQNYVLLTQSESLQPAAPRFPRVISMSRKADVLVGFSTTRNEQGEYSEHTVEMISFNQTKSKFDFHRLNFGKSPVVYEPNPKDCQSCHGKNPRPNWDTYQIWPNALPFNSDRIFQDSEEEKLYRHVLFSLRNDPRFGQLEPIKGVTVTDSGTELAFPWKEKIAAYVTPQGYTIERGGNALLLEHSQAAAVSGDGQATALFDQITKLNAKKVVAELKAHADYPKFKYALQASLYGCMKNAEAYAQFFPESVFKESADYHGMGPVDLMADTRRRGESISQVKLELLEQNLRAVIEANAQIASETLSEETIKRRLYREIYRRNPVTLNVFPVDANTGLNVTEGLYFSPMISAWRFILEPRGIQMKKWSLSASERSLTYTFSDQIGVYQTPMQATLVKDVGKWVSCAKAAEESLAAYGR